MKYKLITIEGNIGAGKTSLATRISADYNGKAVLEEFVNNEFLPKFFADASRHAFAMEMFFLTERYEQFNREMTKEELFTDFVIMDYLFTKSLLYARNNLSEAEYNLYQKLFNIINTKLPTPELIVYLHSDIPRLMENIKMRGREFEKDIKSEYLQRIQDTYFTYFKQNPQLRVWILDVTNCDFVNNKSDYEEIIDLIRKDRPPGLQFRAIGGD